MTWARWWATVILSTLAAIVVSIGAGDFDRAKREEQRRAGIAVARERSGVDGHMSPVRGGSTP